MNTQKSGIKIMNTCKLRVSRRYKIKTTEESKFRTRAVRTQQEGRRRNQETKANKIDY
jgi:hypothetical protein